MNIIYYKNSFVKYFFKKKIQKEKGPDYSGPYEVDPIRSNPALSKKRRGASTLLRTSNGVDL